MTIERHGNNFIGGRWVPAGGDKWIDVINPATEEAIASVRSASVADVDDAVASAKLAFEDFSRSTVQHRIELLERILKIYERRQLEFADALSLEMGAPISVARTSHAELGTSQLQSTIDALRHQELEEVRGNALIVRQPLGVAALITPWNWPINLVFTKVAAALAAGCSMVLKPSEFSPLDALLFAEVVDEAGVPAGVFNLVFGEGPTVGRALSLHGDVDVMSFTGSNRAGQQITIDAAESVKVVHLELGGKSPNVILEDASLEEAVGGSIYACFLNSGQTCSAATRMIVPRGMLDDVIRIARETALVHITGDPSDEKTMLGPLVNSRQYDHVQELIQSGIDQGARLVTGGLGRPEGLELGYYVKPTIFADVTSSMRIAQDEIFGPVLSILAYDTEAEAVHLANDTVYGLAAVVHSGTRAHAVDIARQIKAGQVYINDTYEGYSDLPFGGWKRSGVGSEHAEWGIAGFQGLTAILGAAD